LLKEDKVDVPNDFYDEEILFDGPDQLIDIFSLLEEQNLKKIRACQDIEEQLEKEKLDEHTAVKTMGGIYVKHE
jgi:hypothetical protein